MGWLSFKWAVQDTAERVGNFVTGGGNDRKKSENIVRWAKEEEEEVRERLEEVRESTCEKLAELGQLKTEVYRTSVTEFVQLFEMIGKLNNTGCGEFQEGLSPIQVKNAIGQLKIDSAHVNQMLIGAGSGALGGATLALGAYGLAGIVGTASTGTAISTLSGVAASNATLAWLGGGAASAGGLGVAGGTAVLGGIAVLPVALVAMYFGQNKAKQKLNEARNIRDEIEVVVEEIKTGIEQLEMIAKGADLMLATITALNEIVKAQNSKMRNALEVAASCALALQDTLEIQIISQDGTITTQCKNYLSNQCANA
ncbi:hypothetical protein [Deefgea piscis]|uniref:hypothetical protein n=1 Tax=Deefgea piscis TaxID=2739061 RepID=UPI001C81316E|nr:hypothetical protein [Deefgea piscis]QZA82252.1 hypothetical protein K4H25_06315 [Deefgea piscis]